MSGYRTTACTEAPSRERADARLRALQLAWNAYITGTRTIETAEAVVSAWIELTRWVGNNEDDRQRGLEWVTGEPERFAQYLRSIGPDLTGDTK